MCRLAALDLPPDPRSAPAARAFLRRCLQDWQLQPVGDVLELPLSELVTNALLHARTPMTVTVGAAQQHVEVAVHDGSAELPQPRPERRDLGADLDLLRQVELDAADAVDERDPRLHVGDAGAVVGGRGLLLMQAVVDAWGVRPADDGKAVWVRTATPVGWPAGVGCTCDPRTGIVSRS